jgi:hypothetical protein
MELFVGPLPERADHFSLRHFFQEFHGEFNLQLLDTFNPEETLRFALVRFNSEQLAHKAIRRLDGKKLGSTPVCVREFIQRNSKKDRRNLSWPERLKQKFGRRSNDRRKQRKIVMRDMPGTVAFEKTASKRF